MTNRDERPVPFATHGERRGDQASLACGRCGKTDTVVASQVVWGGESHDHWHCQDCGHAWSAQSSGDAKPWRS